LNRSDFSFGRVSEAGSDAAKDKDKEKGEVKSGELEDLRLNIECYRASVEGLLEENRRLKKSFMTLYRLKQGEKVPDDLMK
jgi:hypothetical protein